VTPLDTQRIVPRAAIGISAWGIAVRSNWFVALSLLLVAVGTLPQLLAPPGVDVSWYLYASGRILEGDRLYEDLIELNPPLIVWLNVPVAWVAHQTGWPAALLYRCFIVLLAVGSFLLTRMAFRRLREPSTPPGRRLFLLLVAFTLLALAAGDFGQREHLMLILVLPYLFVAAARLEGVPVSFVFASLVGVLAGIGVALKPYFLLVPLLVELGRLPIRLRATARPETIAVGLVAIGYLAAVQLWAPSYWPLMTKLGTVYRQFVNVPLLATALVGEGAGVALSALFSSVALRHRKKKCALAGVLLLATIGLYASAVLQQKGWRYHFYPSIATGLLLLALLSMRTREPALSVAGRVYQAVAVALILYLPGRLVTSAALQLVSLRAGPSAGNPDYQSLVNVVRREAPAGSLLALSSNLGAGFPLVLETGTRWASRLPSLWVLGALYHEDLASAQPLVYRSPGEKGALERFVTQLVIEDLERGPPDLLMVERPAPDRWEWGVRRFDYIRYFSQEPRFQTLFSQYGYLGDIGAYRLFNRQQSGERRPIPSGAPSERGEPPARALKPGLYVDRLGNMGLLKTFGFLALVAALILGLPYADSSSGTTPPAGGRILNASVDPKG
jgi:hypothetical protein